MTNNVVSEFANAAFGFEMELSRPSDEMLISLISHAVRTPDVWDRAETLLDIANMAMALADKTLGAQNPVAKCIAFPRH